MIDTNEGYISWSDLIKPDDSIEKFLEAIYEVEKRYQSFAVGVVRNSGAMQKAINDLTAAEQNLVNLQNMSEQARDIKQVAAGLQDALKAINEVKKLSNQGLDTIIGKEHSHYQQLLSALGKNVNAFKELDTAQRANAITTGQYLNAVSHLKLQIESTNKALNSFSTQMRNVREQGKKYRTTMLDLSAAERELFENARAREIASKKAMKMEELTIKINNAEKDSYEQLSARYQRNIMLLKQMSEADYKAASAKGGLVEQTRSLQIRLREMDEAVGNYSRNVGHYQKVWSGFDFSIAQIVREMPNFAISARTGIMALSNNFATVLDEIKVFRMEQKQLAAEGKPTISIFKRLGQSLMSVNTVLMIGVTLFTLYGERFLKWVEGIVKGTNDLTGLNKAMVETNDLFKKGSSAVSDNTAELYRLKREWKDLKDESDKTDWINKNVDAFEKMGLSITSVTDAENAFVQNTDLVIDAMVRRAQAEAALQNVKDKTDKVTKARLEKDAEIAKATGQVPGFLSKTWYGMKRVFTAGEYLSGEEAFGELSPKDQQKVFAALENLARPWAAEEGLTKDANALVTLDTFKELLSKSTGFNIIVKDYINAVKEGDNEINKAKNNLDDAVELQNKLAKEATDEVRRQRRAQLAAEVDEFGELKWGKKAYSISDEYLDWLFNIRMSATTSQDEEVTRLSQKYFGKKGAFAEFKKYKPKSEGAGRKGPEGIDFEAWYLRESENLRHKDALADAKSEEDAWNRQIELIDEKYEHERQKMNQLWKYAVDIQEGRVKVKGGLTDERKSKLSEFIGGFPGYMQEIEDANVRERFDVYNKIKLKRAEHEKAIIDLRLKGVVENSEAERELLKERLDKERELALLRNRLLPEQERQDPADIAKAFDLQEKKMYQSFNVADVKRDESQFKTRFDTETLRRRNADPMFGFNSRQQQIRGYEKELHDLNTQRLLLIDEMESGLADSQRMSEILDELALLDEKSVAAEKAADELQGVKGLLGSISQEGLLGGILNMTGMKDDTRKAVVSSFDIIKDNISSLIDSYVQLAEAAIKAQEQQVSAAQKVVDAELEASKQGYANRVVSAQEELKLEKQKLKEQKKERERALKIQRAMDTAEAASSLTVAIAQLWKSCIGVSGPFGVPMATALTAVMLGSFVASKVKAAKASRMQDEEYGEGGLEFLEGGSHASGNDIDLHTRNSEGKNMRAEGGEAMAIINKRNTRKYKGILPDVIDSLNKGVFEDKYLNAFSQGAQLHAQILAMPTVQQTDLSGLESKLDKLVKQGENKVVSLPNGNTIEYFGNVKRTIKKND